MPIFSLFFGTAQPGSVVTITSPLGSSTAQANDQGNWGSWVVFPNVTGPPPVSVSSSQGTLYPSCGS